jgi:hypothetical protein
VYTRVEIIDDERRVPLIDPINGDTRTGREGRDTEAPVERQEPGTHPAVFSRVYRDIIGPYLVPVLFDADLIGVGCKVRD